MFTSKDIRCFIPTYNRPALLLQTLKTLLWQECGPLEIYVLDNSTNDETKNLIEEKFSASVNYVDNRADQKPLANFRKIRELAITPYSLVVHDDDLLTPAYLKNVLNLLNTYDDISGIFSKFNIFYGLDFLTELAEKHFTQKHWLLQNKADFALSFWDKPACCWTGSVLKSCLYKTTPLENLHKNFGKILDIPFLIEAISQGKVCIFTDKYIYYRVHSGSDTQDDKTAITLQQLTNWLSYYKKFAATNPELQRIYNIYIHIKVSVAKINLSKQEQNKLVDIDEFLIQNNLLFSPQSFRWKIRTKWYFKQLERIERKYYDLNNYYNKFLCNLPKK